MTFMSTRTMNECMDGIQDATVRSSIGAQHRKLLGMTSNKHEMAKFYAHVDSYS